LSGTPASGDIAATELTLTVNDGTVDTEQTFTITVAEAEEEKTPVLVVFEEDANPLWPAWDCCGSSTPAIITDADAGYGQVTQFTINGDTVVGLGFNHDPWTASTENVTLTTEWATYTYTITPEAGDNNSRVLFDMGGEAGDVYLDDISIVAVD